MKTRTQYLLIALTLLASLHRAAAQAADDASTAIVYQGQLSTPTGIGPNGSYDMVFKLFSASSSGSPVAGPITNTAVAVNSNGLFSASMNFGASVFNGSTNWLEVAVRTNGGGAFTTLSPRQQLTPAPYAVTAANLSGTLPAAQLSGTILNSSLPSYPNFFGTVTANSFSGNGANVANVNAATLSGLTSAGFWKTSGNAGANPTNGVFLGTTDNMPLEIKVSGQRVLRLENNFSTAMGYNTTASGYSSIAIGYSTISTNFAATAIGSFTTAGGDSSTAMGTGTVATGDFSTALGYFTLASNAW